MLLYTFMPLFNTLPTFREENFQFINVKERNSKYFTCTLSIFATHKDKIGYILETIYEYCRDERNS